MSTPDPTLPPPGTAMAPAGQDGGVPPSTATPAAAGASPEPQSSVQKVEAAIASMLATRGPAVQAFLGPVISSLNLPQEASQLDQLLAEGSGYLLTLRSDGAAPVTIGAQAGGATSTAVHDALTSAYQKANDLAGELAAALAIP